MSRSRFTFTLGVALGCAGMVQAQVVVPSTPAGIESRVGKTVTVAEANRAVEKGVVLQAWKLADGSAAMVVRALESSEMMTVIESATPSASTMPFVVFRWGAGGIPPKGCPMPPQGMPTGDVVVQASAPAPTGRSFESMPAMHVTSSAQPMTPIATSATRVWPQNTGGMHQGTTVHSSVATGPILSTNEPVAEQIMAMPRVKGEQVVQQVAGTTTKTAASMPAKPMQNSIMPPSMTPAPVTASKPAAPAPAKPAKVMAANMQAPATPAPQAAPRVTEVKPAPTAPTAATPAPASGRVVSMPALPGGAEFNGRIITVQEKNCPPDTCRVLDTFCWQDGTPAMAVQSLSSGEKFTIIERKGHGLLGSKGNSGTYAATAPQQPTAPVVAKQPEPVKPHEIVVTKAPAPVEPPPQVVTMPPQMPPAMTQTTEQLPVPVPLMPLATNQPRPEAAPPQPPVNSFNTMKSVSMEEAVKERPPLKPVERPQMEVPAEITTRQQGTAPTMPSMAPSGVVSSQWSKAPMVPVTKTSVMHAPMTEREAQVMQNVVHLLTVLQTSGTPSQREQAATQLKHIDPQASPYVVETLATVAKTDTAPMVRAAAISSLGHMKVRSTVAMAAIEAGSKDKDPRVRDEAQQALAAMGTTGASTVKQAGHSSKK